MFDKNFRSTKPSMKLYLPQISDSATLPTYLETNCLCTNVAQIFVVPFSWNYRVFEQ